MDEPARPEAGAEHGAEPHVPEVRERLNWLRAGVLGANDGIISTAGLVIGVAAATSDTTAVAAAGLAGVVAGAVSMALGEYVSVSAQRDTELALVRKERHELAEMPDTELRELRSLLRRRGLSAPTAQAAAAEMTAHDALAAHLDLELGIDRAALANPWSAALSSAVSFVIGSVLPLVAILVPPRGARIPIAFGAVLVALAATGWISVALGDGRRGQAITRLLVGGSLAMAVTYGVGELVGATI